MQIHLCSECDLPAFGAATHPKCKRAFGLDGLLSVFHYDGVIKKAIKLLKYQLVSDCAQDVIHLIPKNTLNLVPQHLVLYPIPLHKNRLKWRGFNQAQVLGKYIAQKLEIEMVSGLLCRTNARTPQADINRRSLRLQNMRGVFTLKSPQLPKRILLVDDVYTTGATLKEATKMLKRNGVEVVWGLTIAR